jgi:hypothetical protein
MDALPPEIGPPALPAEIRPADPGSYGGPRLGAQAPPLGNLVLSLGAGAAILLPQVTADARIGLGASTSLDFRYRNLAVYGHFGQARFTWSMPIAKNLSFGLALRTGIGSLSEGDGAKFGINFSALSLGNDWDVGHDLLLTWTRPHHAHITTSIGPTYALGGPRYTTFDKRDFQWDLRWQSVTATLLGEWEITQSRRFFLRLDGQFIVKADVVPYGFLPTFTIGHAWST